MLQVDHPNIVKYYETYEDNFFIYLCMELMEGGVLIAENEERAHSELDAVKYFTKIINAL